jgi:ABC-type antimicrobial peptide transport system permease subunit
VLQFVISQFFIIGTLVMISQMNYFSKKELGFRKDAIIVIPIPEREIPAEGPGVSKMRTLREEVSRLAGVEMASLANTPPSSGSVNGTGFRFEGEGEEARKDTEIKQIDGHYINLFGLQLIAGESLEDGDTARAFVVNEQLTRVAGFKTPEEIIGKRMRVWGKVLPVVGVVRDFHSVSLREPIEPIVMMNRIRGYESLSLKINPLQLQDIIKEVRVKWEADYPNHIFEYKFLDEQIREFYESERKLSILLSVFTSMAIFIGCLGLFGLATFMANQKTKEIGVRKVLGASAESIVISFCTEYFKLIMIGFVIAAPLSWLVMNEWLNGFEYKITIGAGMFLASLAITLLVALLTVGYKSLKAAIMNPVNSLRYE